MFPYGFQEEPRGAWEGSLDVEGGNDEVYRVHAGDGVLEEDGLVWGPARDGPPEAGGYVGVQVGADAAQEDGPDSFDLCDCTDYGAPVVRVGPVRFFVEGADNVCPVSWQRGLPRDDVPAVVGEDAEEVGGEMVVFFCREAVIALGFLLTETVDGLADFVDGEGALFWLPPLGVVEDLREAVDFVLGVRVQCVPGGCVLMEEAVLGGLEHGGWVVGEKAVLLPDRGDGSVAGVGHGVVEVADGLSGEFMLRIPFVLLGDALLPVDVPVLQVRPDTGYLRHAVVDVAAGLGGVDVEEGRQLLLRMEEVMGDVPQGRGWPVILSLGVLLETAIDGGCAHGCE